MDDVIRGTRAYSGREDFVAEAVSDRLGDERARTAAVAQSLTLVEEGESGELRSGLVLALWQQTSVVTAPQVR